MKEKRKGARSFRTEAEKLRILLRLPVQDSGVFAYPRGILDGLFRRGITVSGTEQDEHIVTAYGKKRAAEVMQCFLICDRELSRCIASLYTEFKAYSAEYRRRCRNALEHDRSAEDRLQNRLIAEGLAKDIRRAALSARKLQEMLGAICEERCQKARASVISHLFGVDRFYCVEDPDADADAVLQLPAFHFRAAPQIAEIDSFVADMLNNERGDLS